MSTRRDALNTAMLVDESPRARLPFYWRLTRIVGPIAGIAIAPASWLIAVPEIFALSLMLGSAVFGIAALFLCTVVPVRVPNLVLIAIVSFTFFIWGYVIGACVPAVGVTGIAQAAITGAIISELIRRRRLALLFVLALVPAWAVAMVWPPLAHALQIPSPPEVQGWDRSNAASFFPLLVAVWVAVALWLLAEETRKPRSLASESHRCPDCDYDLLGNTTGICPECGIPIGPSSAAQRPG